MQLCFWQGTIGTLNKLCKRFYAGLDTKFSREENKGCLEACQNQCEELAALLVIQLKILGIDRNDQKQLFLTTVNI
jgi:hypothetical protein